MSTCGCPNPYSFTAGTCIYDTAAFSGVSGASVTLISGDLSYAFGSVATLFYEDVTNKTFPLTFNNNSISSPPYTSVTINPLQECLLVDGTNFTPSDISAYYGYNDVNISGVPINVIYSATSSNLLWCSDFQIFPSPSTYGGRMNAAGIKVSTGLHAWVGFSYCLDVPSTQQYHLMLGADDLFRLKLNGSWFIKRINSVPATIGNYSKSIVADGSIDTRYSGNPSYDEYILGWVNYYQVYNHCIPITLDAGVHIFEFSFTDTLSSSPNDTNAVFEIYSGVTTADLTGYTSYSQLSGAVVFSTSQITGTTQISPAESGDTYGVWCNSGEDLLGLCDNAPFCRAYTGTTGCCPSAYCIYDTGTIIDDNYILTDFYDGETYWVGQNNGYYIYYQSANTQWCVSVSLGGSCLLAGKSPCTTTCPDICESYFFSGACPTPTPSPTQNCNTLDFSAIFDCQFTPTPSITPTITTTPTVTPTPSTSSLCSLVSVSASITAYTPTPTSTVTVTPTPTPSPYYDCNFSGDVTFTAIEGIIICPGSDEFEDCYDGTLYYTSDYLVNPSPGEIQQYMVFKASVDGISKCIFYKGRNENIQGVNNIILVNGPYGFSVSGDCKLCTPDLSPSPTPTITPSPTPTVTPTVTPTPSSGSWYIYRSCEFCVGGSSQKRFVYQNIPGPTVTVGQVFINPDDELCWEFVGTTGAPPPSTPCINTIFGNYFTTPISNFYETCESCQNCGVFLGPMNATEVLVSDNSLSYNVQTPINSSLANYSSIVGTVILTYTCYRDNGSVINYRVTLSINCNAFGTITFVDEDIIYDNTFPYTVPSPGLNPQQISVTGVIGGFTITVGRITNPPNCVCVSTGTQEFSLYSEPCEESVGDIINATFPNPCQNEPL